MDAFKLANLRRKKSTYWGNDFPSVINYDGNWKVNGMVLLPGTLFESPFTKLWLVITYIIANSRNHVQNCVKHGQELVHWSKLVCFFFHFENPSLSQFLKIIYNFEKKNDFYGIMWSNSLFKMLFIVLSSSLTNFPRSRKIRSGPKKQKKIKSKGAWRRTDGEQEPVGDEHWA